MISTITKTKNLPGSFGFSMIELLIAIFILQLILAPVYLMFTESQKTMYKAADTTNAAHLASSLIAALREIPVNMLRAQPLENDTELESPYSLQELGVMMVPEEFTRKIEILPVDSAKKEGGPFYMVEVQVKWFNRRTETSVDYVIRDLLAGKQ